MPSRPLGRDLGGPDDRRFEGARGVDRLRAAHPGPYGCRVRWDDLFADLAGQLEAGPGAEQAELVADLTRAERAGITLTDRFRAHRGPVRLVPANGESLSGEVTDAGPDWVLIIHAERGPKWGQIG